MQTVPTPISNVNRRVRPGLLSLNSISHPTQIIACRTDKLEIAISGTINFYNQDQLESCLYIFSGESSSRHSVGRVLNAMRGSRGNALGRVQPIRNGNWLFSGHLKHGRTYDNQRMVSLQLTINPTRFAEHCYQRFAPSTLDDISTISAYDLLHCDPTTFTRIARCTLDGNDNYLSSNAWLTYVSRHWSSFVLLYTTRICELVEHDFNRRSEETEGGDAPTLRLQRPGDTSPSFGYVEQYIEFHVDDALNAYRYLERRILQASSSHFQNNMLTTGRNGNASWVTCQITRYVTLKLYAKSSTRLRLELEYHGPSSGSNRSLNQIVRQEHRQGFGSYVGQLDALRHDAVERLSHALRAIGTDLDLIATPDLSTTLANFVFELCSSRYPRCQINEFVRILFAEGSIDCSGNRGLRIIADALTRKEILRPVSLATRSSGRRYVASADLGRLIELTRTSNE